MGPATQLPRAAWAVASYLVVYFSDGHNMNMKTTNQFIGWPQKMKPQSVDSARAGQLQKPTAVGF